MENIGAAGTYGLEPYGIRNPGRIYWNCSPARLIEEVVRRNEGAISDTGAVIVNTGVHTGRSPNDKYVVRREDQKIDEMISWGKVNQPVMVDAFQSIYERLCVYLQSHDLFVQDVMAGAHPGHQIPIRVITNKAWAALFSENLFVRPPVEKRTTQVPLFSVIHAPDFQADKTDGLNSGTFIMIDFHRKLILIGGTSYAGEIKKSIFTVMNYIHPLNGILSMHCSANVGLNGDVALFFGLSGTGKTSLSSDPERCLIGDDEHGWSQEGVFNFEGGCYAKTIRLRRDYEPLIWDACHRFGTVLENVVYDPASHEIDFDDERFTENTRAAYPIEFIPNHVPGGTGGNPDTIFFLTADASGVMPPLARLSAEQAMYYFLSGYTSKLAGTEKGLGTQPQATFSACFGAPFLPLFPHYYADLLGKKLKSSQTQVWLINTGWTGGPYGTGERIRIPFTRAMVRAVLTRQLENTPLHPDDHFQLAIPENCPDVPVEILHPKNTWHDPSAYDQSARELISRFEKNFETYKTSVSAAVLAAGPHNQ